MEIENQESQGLPEEKKQSISALRVVFYVLKVIGFVCFIAFVPYYLVYYVRPVQDFGINLFAPSYDLANDSVEVDFEKISKMVQADLEKNSKQLNSMVPKKPYIVISKTENKFWLYNEKNVLVVTGVCSTGSQVVLDNGVKQWTFSTPTGVHSIRSKVVDPVWTKPDWAFIEEGLPVPGARHSSRYEPGVLGDYALHIGDGYMIHGTIYQRFLGMAVTHGCIRLGDKELELVFKNLVVGSKVFVY